MTIKQLLLLLAFLSVSLIGSGQELISIKGRVFSDSGETLEMVNILAAGQGRGSISDSLGLFQIEALAAFPLHLQFSRVGHKPKEIVIENASAIEASFKVVLETDQQQLKEVKVRAAGHSDQWVQQIDPRATARIPMPSGYAIEGLVRSQMGVSSGNELSTQYRVRGGNFDENLVYINGIEVYRPLLIRSGQQEGLSIVNPDLTGSVFFSAGGFGVNYGDKMSSVLDIRYKKPDSASAGGNINLLGARAFVQGKTRNNKLSWIGGYRHKTNRYLLGTLDTKGDYNPSFSDVQAFFRYRFTPAWSAEVFAYYALNRYHFKPTDRETTFGTLSEVKRLKIFFAGKEQDQFETGMGAVKLNFDPSRLHHFELAASHYRAFEEENFDIAGAYWLQDVIGNGENESVTNIGVGESFRHARNDLLGTVTSGSVKGTHALNPKNTMKWGLNAQWEHFSDRINEYEVIDSAGYSIPRWSDNLEFSYSRNARNRRDIHRLSAYLSHEATLVNSLGRFELNYGTRLLYGSDENKLWVTPRFQMMYYPGASVGTRLRLSGGWYFQPPFYKEFRPPQSDSIPELSAQKSVQILAGVDRFFEAFERPFKFSAELYYKHFSDLIPYQVDNVRIQYSGRNEATGYAAGIDFKLNGEFVPGTESWATLSLLMTEENLEDDQWLDPERRGEPGYIPRPTDQRVNFSLFFQDYLPGNPTFKVHLSLLFGTALPFGPPRSPRYLATNRMPPYRRVDMGFSKDLLPWLHRGYDKRGFLKDAWLGLELFNLFDINNTISYYWVNDVQNRQYAVPNYLTSRRVNVSLTVAF